ncbi:MAG: YihY/virulence factor BrkB family protein, partial [Dehalococcoidia bacterium]
TAGRNGRRVLVTAAWRRGLAHLLTATAVRTGHCQVFAHSGNIAFRGLFALFPAVIAGLWLLRVLRSERLIAGLLRLTDTALPTTASAPIRQLLTEAPHDEARGAFTVGALAAAAAALWALASMMRALMNGLNAIYGVDERRPFWRSTLVSVLLALAVTVLLLAALFLVVFGSALAQQVAEEAGWGAVARWAWQLAVWPVLTGLVLCACMLIYHIAPDAPQHPRLVSPGALLVTILWLLFSWLYAIYVNRFASYEDLYGTLAGIVVLMAYSYVVAFILLLGAVVSHVLEMRYPPGRVREGAPAVSASVQRSVGPL